MKSKYVILASAILISVTTFAQKDQIKAAEKALKGGSSTEAIDILKGAESSISNASASEKAQYYFVQGNAHMDLANKKTEEGKNLSMAAKSFQDLLEVEKNSGKDKYSSEATKTITDIKNRLVNAGIKDTKEDKYVESAKKFYDAYLLDKKDTVNLYYTAYSYVNAKDYPNALKSYQELKDLHFTGKGKVFLAVSKVSGAEDSFNTAKERDLAVKIGTHEKPKTEKVPSKSKEINKNIALILIQDGKIEEAKKAVADAKLESPEDASLIVLEANLYLQTQDYDTYKKLIASVLDKFPNDADMIYNLAVISTNAKNAVDAEKYYKRVMEIDPKYFNAYFNYAALKLEEDTVIIDQMSKLTTSKTDTKKYDELKAKRDVLFKSVIPYLKTAHELEPKNISAAKTLMNIYSALEMSAEKKVLKAEIAVLEAEKK